MSDDTTLSMSDTIADSAAKAVFDKFTLKFPGRAFEGGFLSKLLDALMEAFGDCQERNPPENIERLATGRQGLRVRRSVRRNVRKSLSRPEWNEYGPEMADSILEAAKDSRPGEVASLADIEEI